MDNLHSILPPSGAGCWGKDDGCTGWVMMNQLYPTEPTQDSLEGDAAHEVASQLIKMYKTGNAGLANSDQFVGKTTTNGIVITDEIFDSALIYANDVHKHMQEYHIFGGDDLRIEERTNIPTVHLQQFGTPDCSMRVRSLRKAILWDFKHGHSPVGAVENWQMIDYAAGLLDDYGINGLADQSFTVEFRIIQPRAYHVDGTIRSWTVKASDLRGYINTLKRNAEIALTNPTFNTGSQCRHCPGRHACEPALKAGKKLFEAAGAPTPVELTNVQMGFKLVLIERAMEQLKALQTGFKTQLEHKIKSGEAVPYWSMKSKAGNLKWKLSDEEILKLHPELSKPGVMTPTQAKELHVDISEISERSASAAVLTQDPKVSLIFKE